MNRIKLLTMGALAAVGLSACASVRQVVGGAGGESDFARGSALTYRLSGADREALAAAFTTAMETGAPQEWRSGRAAGAIEPEGYSLANMMENEAQRIPAARGDLDLSRMMETELGLYVLKRDGNVRIGPSTDYTIAEMLPSGTGIDVVGRVVGPPGRSWVLGAVDGTVRGYISETLLIKAPGTELELAGGPRRKPVLCRDFSQRLDVSAASDEWTGAACNDGTGWRIAPPPPEPAEADDPEIDGL